MIMSCKDVACRAAFPIRRENAGLDDAYASLPVFPETFPAGMNPPCRAAVARTFIDAVVLGRLPRAGEIRRARRTNATTRQRSRIE